MEINFSNFIKLFGLALCFSSCKFEFNNEDLRPYLFYEVDELLIFESDEKHIDTFRITSKEIYYNNWQPITADENYNPPNAVIKYEKLNSNEFKIYNLNKNEYQNSEFIHIRKRTPNSPTIMALSFQTFYKEVDLKNDLMENTFINFNGLKMKCYIVTDSNAYRHKDIKRIYLSENYNLIRYETNSGTIWNRIE